MKRSTVLVACFCLVIQPSLALAETAPPIEGADTRLYLADGSLVEGTLIEKDKDLVIIRIEEKIFTFDKTDIDKLVTLESLGGGARNTSSLVGVGILPGVGVALIAWRVLAPARNAVLRKLISEVKGTAPMISRTACADTIACRAAFRTAVRARARVFSSAPLLNSVPRCCIGLA